MIEDRFNQDLKSNTINQKAKNSKAINGLVDLKIQKDNFFRNVFDAN